MSWNTSTCPSHDVAGPYADGRHRDGLGDLAARSSGMPSSTMAKHPASVMAMASSTSSFGAGPVATLHPVAAHGVHGLRGKAQVAHDRYLGVEDGMDDVEPFHPALELDGAGAGPDEAGGVVYRLGAALVVAGPGQVAHDQLGWLRPGYRSRVADHVVHGHVQGVVVPQHDHAEGVARRG